MTDHHTGNSCDQAVTNRIERHQQALESALDGVLDIEAGLREILIHSRHDSAVDRLGTLLGTEAGLAAILPPAASRLPAPDTGDPASAEEIPLALSPAGRMTLRNNPDVKAASLALTRALTRDLNLDLSLDLALDLARALDRALDLHRDLNLARTIARDLGRDLDRALALAGDLDLGLHVGRDLDHALNQALNHARTLSRALNHDHGLDLARDLDRALTLTLTPARDLNRDVVLQIRAREVCRAIGWVLRREPPVLDTDSVHTLLDDFTNADLRTADLTGIDLSGVHWSEHTTQWPPAVDIEDLKSHSAETPPGSGTWIIRSGTATIRDHAAYLK
ncbi:hypothetical protein ACIQI8_42010 [Streptomyces sp. NPDC092369]|uniref:hypothetical protein n=1 Tax=Streptomyces sp. NPDC092369 TaxID=3366015 RepID=UPI00381E7219